MGKRKEKAKKKHVEDISDVPQAKKKRNDLIEIKGCLRNTSIKITVEASPEAWKEMFDRYVIRPFENNLNKDFYFFITHADYFINPLIERPKKSRPNWHYVREIKVFAGLICGLIELWYTRPEKQWPSTFKKIAQIEIVETVIDIRNPVELTAYLLEKIYCDSLKHYGVKSFIIEESDADHGRDNFKKTYIADGKQMLSFENTYGIDDLRDDFCSLYAMVLSYKKGNAFYKKDTRLLNFLCTVMEAATLTLSKESSATNEVKRIHRDVSEIFPAVIRTFR